ncbi:cytoplasmic polyadenylation element-binding protein 1-like [Watersipora subatra]|uniref:cytoplasmic polyadenylation element-binding protein 1-like n=1 Tax=Watersipora subatra TaxID=2589382 RepID=UPI00355C807D
MAGVDAIAMPSPVQVRRDMQARIEKSERAISPLTTMLKETSLSPRGTSSPNSSTAKKGQPNGLRISSFQGNSFKCSSTTSDIGYQTIDSPSQPVEKAAIMHRHAASSHEANCTWSGVLPIRKYDNPTYSNKVFLGGVPWDIEPGGVQEAFTEFGHVKVEFPGNVPFQKKFGGRPRSEEDSVHCYGYLYVIFESDKHVKEMLKHCTRGGPHGKKEGSCSSNGDGEYYYKISSRKMRSKEVQVIPWVLCDSNYVAGPHPYHKLNNETTIFVGALHGMLNAEGLAHVMNDLFGNVVYAGVDTDKYKYPIGSGRVTFSSHRSYMRAVNAAFVEIKTTKFVKKVQIDPYLEEVPCSVCNSEVGPYFCRNQCCFKYYCSRCWSKVHGDIDPSLGVHSPVMRNSKNGGSANVSIKTNLSDLYKKLSSEP